jgi:serine/threonine-protein kinase
MEQIGRYRIVGELGRGAMGIVYRAQDPTIGRTVAIKTIRLSEVTDPKERERLRERLFREAQSAGALSHPNIVTIYDVAEEGDLAYIAMEYVEGQTLDRVLASGELPGGQQLLEILRQTAAALDYAHHHGIVHRDIKPANVMIDDRGTAKIADFGVAKILSQQMTQAAGIIGTPNYMSPEQVEGAPLDGRADQFALAVIAYEVLTGDKPFVGEPLPTLLYKIVHEEPLSPQRLNPTLGWQVETVLKKALSKDPAKRYPNCTEFVKALTGACNAKKGWKPIAPGHSQNMPTIAAAAPALAHPRRTAARLEHEDSPGIARRAAVVVALAAFLGLGGFSAYRYFALPPGTSAPAPAQNEAPPQLAPSDPVTTPPADTSPPPSPQEPADAASAGTAEEKPGPVAPDPPPQEQSKAQHQEQPQEQAQAQPPAQEQQAETPVPIPPADRGESPSRGEAMVALDSSPPGAIVIVDGRARSACRTPCTVPLANGRHSLVASLPGYRGTMRTFQVPNENSVRVVLERATGVLGIRSTPAGASITINGQLRAERTPTRITLPEGKYRLVVSKDGVSSEETEVEVREGATRTINYDFQERR